MLTDKTASNTNDINMFSNKGSIDIKIPEIKNRNTLIYWKTMDKLTLLSWDNLAFIIWRFLFSRFSRREISQNYVRSRYDNQTYSGNNCHRHIPIHLFCFKMFTNSSSPNSIRMLFNSRKI